MARKSSQGKSKRRAKPIFDSIRKPNAPPGHPLTNAKPDERARPAGRKAKHKRRPEEAVEVEDID
jgi:hypothetical protein